jgi:hypothetical protein
MPKGGPSALTDGPISSQSPIAVIEVSDDDEVIEILDEDEEIMEILDDDENYDDPPGKKSNSRISHISGVTVSHQSWGSQRESAEILPDE